MIAMKRFNIHTVLPGCLLAATLTACNDVKDLDAGYIDTTTSTGAPHITAVYDIADAKLESPIIEGVLNQYIHIKGENLSQVKSLNINGLEVDLRTRLYAENHDAYVRIPRAIPTEETGVIRYVTELGETTYNFPVSIPKLELNGLANEFAFAGERVQLSGDYFDLYNFGDTLETSPVSIVITNDELGYSKTLHCDSCTEKYTSIRIPADCPDNSLITFAWDAIGGGRATKSVPFRMTKYLLFGNFDGDLGWWNDWGKGLVEAGWSQGAPASLGYNYLRIHESMDVWSWNSTGFGTQWPAGIDDYAQWVLKFEVNTAAAYPFYDYGDNGGDTPNGGYMLTLSGDGADGRWQFDPVSQGIKNTSGNWITYTVDLLDVTRGGKVHAAGEWVSLELAIQPNNSDGWTVDHCFGQFRIEPKNY